MVEWNTAVLLVIVQLSVRHGPASYPRWGATYSNIKFWSHLIDAPATVGVIWRQHGHSWRCKLLPGSRKDVFYYYVLFFAYLAAGHNFVKNKTHCQLCFPNEPEPSFDTLKSAQKQKTFISKKMLQKTQKVLMWLLHFVGHSHMFKEPDPQGYLQHFATYTCIITLLGITLLGLSTTNIIRRGHK